MSRRRPPTWFLIAVVLVALGAWSWTLLLPAPLLIPRHVSCQLVGYSWDTATGSWRVTVKHSNDLIIRFYTHGYPVGERLGKEVGVIIYKEAEE